MYILNYNKATNIMFDISKEKKEHLGNIEITEEEKQEIMTILNNDCYIVVIDDKWSFLPNFCNAERRKELVEMRDQMLIEQDPYHTEHYQAYLSATKGITIDEIYLTELNEYYARLLDLPNSYDICENQSLFEVIIVDEYSDIEDSITYELVKPDFIK